MIVQNTGQKSTDIESFIRLIHGVGSVFEVRSLHCPDRPGGNFRSTASGYFYNAREATKAIKQLESLKPPAIYLTLNPVESSLLARSVNRIDHKAKATSNDGDILKRNWLFIDIDSKRKAGISATDLELHQADLLSEAVRAELTSLGWPEPLQGMSGNGRYLLYRIDLPNDDDSRELIKSVLHAMAGRFNSDGAEVDCSTYNAGRIIKVLGTIARKGDELVGVEGIEDRRHRQSWFIQPDCELKIVSLKQLQDVTAWIEAKPKVDPVRKQKTNKSDSDALVRASAYLGTMQPSVDGDKGHNNLLKAAAALAVGFSLSDTEVFNLLWNEFNPRCQPVWSDKQIIRKIDEARKKPQKPQGYLLNEKKRSDGYTNSDGNGKPEIQVTLNENYVADQVVECLGNLGWSSSWIPSRHCDKAKVFVRGGRLADAIESEDEKTKGKLVIRFLPKSMIRERITQSCKLFVEKETKEGIEKVFQPPQKWLIDAIDDRGFYNGKLKYLAGVIESPTLRPDGSVLQTAGYDESTGLIYRPNAQFPKVPEKPTVDDARKAVDELLETVVDFPFLSPSDSSAWLALAFSMIGRTCVSGCVPLFAITANIRGAGKSMLVDLASLIAYGRPSARLTFTKEDAELKKVITAIAIEAVPSVLFDNLDVQLGGASLDAALTAETWTDRILGGSQTTGELPLRTVWSATGNNLTFGSDVARRVLPIRLQSELENPEERVEFRHSDLLGWVRDNRPRLAIAALTILRAYFVAGKPKQADGVFGSFENWTELVRGGLVWTGLADPLANRETAKADDQSSGIVRGLIGGLLEVDEIGKGLTVREIVKALDDPSNVNRFPTMREVICEVATNRGSIDQRKLTYVFRKFKNRTANGWKIIGESGHGGVNRWNIKQVNGGDGGYGDHAATDSPTRERKSQSENPNLIPGKTSSPSPPSPLPEVCQCGAEMVSTEPFEGVQTWYCPQCREAIDRPVEVVPC